MTPTQYFTTLDEPRKSEMKQMFSLIKEAAPSLKSFVHETAHGVVVGFGKQSYETKSGCKGDWFTVGLASRKGGIALYICAAKDGEYLPETYKKDFAKAKIGKSCITFKNAEDINKEAVKRIVKEAEKLGMCFA